MRVIVYILSKVVTFLLFVCILTVKGLIFSVSATSILYKKVVKR